jgi:pyridoxine 4-dehydrogenase
MDHGEKGKIMAKLDARKSGSFKINGDIEIHRLGVGAMRITGPRVWGSTD